MAPTTTSATRPGRRPKRRSDRTGPGGAARGWDPVGRPRAGVTIIEIVLAIGLLVLLASVMITGFGRWYETERIDEGARRLESILRLARAEAASCGRRIRLAFDSETLRAVIEWEPSPLAEPGVYVAHPGEWGRDLPNDQLRFRRCQRIGASGLQVLTVERDGEMESESGQVLQEVVFYPDGSFDSAIIEVVDPAEHDERIGRVDLDGVNGTIRMRILTPTEQAEQAELDEEAGT